MIKSNADAGAVLLIALTDVEVANRKERTYPGEPLLCLPANSRRVHTKLSLAGGTPARGSPPSGRCPTDHVPDKRQFGMHPGSN